MAYPFEGYSEFQQKLSQFINDADAASAIELIRSLPRDDQNYILYHLPMEFAERIVTLVTERAYGDDLEMARDLGALRGYANTLSSDLERPYSLSLRHVYERCRVIVGAMDASLRRYPMLPQSLRCYMQITREILSDFISAASFPGD